MEQRSTTELTGRNYPVRDSNPRPPANNARIIAVSSFKCCYTLLLCTILCTQPTFLISNFFINFIISVFFGIFLNYFRIFLLLSMISFYPSHIYICLVIFIYFYFLLFIIIYLTLLEVKGLYIKIYSLIK